MGILKSIKNIADKASETLRAPFKDVGTSIATGGKSITSSPIAIAAGKVTSAGTSAQASVGSAVSKAASSITGSSNTGVSTKSSGGRSGGGSSSGSISSTSSAPQLTITKTENKDVGKDVPASYIPPTVISSYKAPSFRDYFNDMSGRFKADSSRPLQNIYESTTGFLKGQKYSKIDQPLSNLGNKVSSASTNVINTILPSESAKFVKVIDNFNTKDKELNNKINAFNEKYGSGELPPDEYARSVQERNNLNQAILNRDKAAENLDKVSKDIAKREKINVAIFTGAFVKELINTPIAIAKFATSPIKTTKETIQALPQLPSQLITSPSATTGSLAGSLAGWYLAGKFVGKVYEETAGKINEVKINEEKLNKALEDVELKVKSVKGFISESDIKLLRLSDPEKAEILAQLRAGHSVRLTKYSLDHLNPASRNIINKAFPKRKTQIYSYEIIDTLGNAIMKKNLIGFEIAKGRMVYKEFTTGEGFGAYNPKTKTGTIETIYKRAEAGKPIKEVSKVKEIFKSEKPIYKELSSGERLKATLSRGATYQGKSIKATPKKPITYKDLTEVAKSEKFGKYPSRISKQGEVTKVESIEARTIKLRINEKDILGFAGKNILSKIIKGAGKSEKFNIPIEFERVATSKSMKPFSEYKQFKQPKQSANVNQILKQIEKPKQSANVNQILEQIEKPKQSANVNQILKQIEKPKAQLKVEEINIPSSDFTFEIIKSVKGAVKHVSKQQIKVPEITFANLDKSMGKNKAGSELGKVWGGSVVNKDLVKELDKEIGGSKNVLINLSSLNNKGKGRTKQGERSSTTSIQAQPQLQTQKQVEQQINKLKQLPTLNIPTITIPLPPTLKIPEYFTLPSHNQGGGGYNLLKKLTKKQKIRTPKYTAGLPQAFFNTPRKKVTLEQYKALSKKTYLSTATNPMLEIVPDKELKKELKKAVNFD